MISVIVPVYNTEPYLRKCLDSIINQTYTNLEILVIDDGSTDKSGLICDEYAEQDQRIRVFHTENHGLSAARNLGLDNANGKYIGFVDSDDWIDLDMYEDLLKISEITGVDVVECGFYQEYTDNCVQCKRPNKTLTGYEAIKALICEETSNAVWCKLWKRQCFDFIRFPEGRVNEDIATTYRVYKAISNYCMVDICKYHYLQRDNSLSRKHTMQNLTSFWLAHHERYDCLISEADNTMKRNLLKSCAVAAARTWAFYYDCPRIDRKACRCIVKEMNEFTTDNFPLFGSKEWEAKLRIGIFFPHYFNVVVLMASWIVFHVSKLIDGL